LIEKAGAPGRDHLFLSRNFHGELPFRVEKDYVDLYNPKRAVRTSTRLYVRNYAPFSQPRQPPPAECVPLPEETTADWGASWELPGGPMDPEELYDLRGDPDETINLATHPDQQAVLRELRKLLDHDMRTSGDFLPTGLPPPRPESPGWGANWPITPIAR
jgi:arylsulfatase A-like enzyme